MQTTDIITIMLYELNLRRIIKIKYDLLKGQPKASMIGGPGFYKLASPLLN